MKPNNKAIITDKQGSVFVTIFIYVHACVYWLINKHNLPLVIMQEWDGVTAITNNKNISGNEKGAFACLMPHSFVLLLQDAHGYEVGNRPDLHSSCMIGQKIRQKTKSWSMLKQISIE